MGAFFAAFEDGVSSASIKIPDKSVKAISVQALSANKFLILDSLGKLHILCLSYSVQGLYSPCPMLRLTHSMKVVKLAVFHDVSTGTLLCYSWSIQGYISEGQQFSLLVRSRVI